MYEMSYFVSQEGRNTESQRGRSPQGRYTMWKEGLPRVVDHASWSTPKTGVETSCREDTVPGRASTNMEGLLSQYDQMGL